MMQEAEALTTNIIGELTTFKETKNVSWKYIARRAGISEARLYKVRRGNYPGDVDKAVAAIGGFLDIARQREDRHFEMKYVETTQVRHGMGCLKFCHTHNEMGMIVSAAGLGKTTLLNRYAEQNSNVLMVTAWYGITCYDMMEAILGEVGLVVSGQANRKMKKLIPKLKDTGCLLVIDEAQHLRHGVLERLRHIHDRSGIGVVLVGNPIVEEQMTGKDLVMYDQLFSRVGMIVDLEPTVTKNDVAALLAASNFKGRDNDELLVKYLRTVAESKGHFRHLYKVLLKAHDIVNHEGTPLNVDIIKQAERLSVRPGRSQAGTSKNF